MVNSTHVNSEFECIEICEALLYNEEFVHVLVIHDDPPPQGSGVGAPMLLDKSTREWLKQRLEELDNGD